VFALETAGTNTDYKEDTPAYTIKYGILFSHVCFLVATALSMY
jgi:hypothetical protein